MTGPSTRLDDMSDMAQEPVNTLLFSAILLTFGSVATVVLDSWTFASLFIVMALAWIARIVAVIRDRHK